MRRGVEDGNGWGKALRPSQRVASEKKLSMRQAAAAAARRIGRRWDTTQRHYYRFHHLHCSRVEN